jgi:D-alanyl-D-alanine carboxypeptidase
MNRRKSVLLAALMIVAASLGSCGTEENIDIKVRPEPAVMQSITEKTSDNESALTQEEQTEALQADVILNETEMAEITTLNESEEKPAEQTKMYETEAPQVQTELPVSSQAPVPETSAEETYENPAEEVEPTYISGVLIANKTYSLPRSYNPGQLSTETQEAFNQMQSAAWSEGHNLWIQSGFRSYDTQERIYNDYVTRDGQAEADTYSARPGHSEHQTGLAFDLNTIDSSFAYTAEGKWVAANCHKYGFIVRYPESKEHITGYKYEPWHLRYLGTELATKVYESGLCLEEYLGITSQYSD